MTKPIRYFVTRTADSTGLISGLEESCGSNFENLTQSEKLWLLSCIAGSITADVSEDYEPADVREEAVILGESISDRLNELPIEDQLGLIKSLAENYA